jgi:hypothetical protein
LSYFDFKIGQIVLKSIQRINRNCQETFITIFINNCRTDRENVGVWAIHYSFKEICFKFLLQIIVSLSERQINTWRIIQETTFFDKFQCHIITVTGQRCKEYFNRRPIVYFVVEIFTLFLAQIKSINLFNNSIEQSNIFTLLLYDNLEIDRSIWGKS